MDGAPDHSQTTWVWIGVSCPVEQPLRCDLLKLNLSIRGICPLWTGESLVFSFQGWWELSSRSEAESDGGRWVRVDSDRNDGVTFDTVIH